MRSITRIQFKQQHQAGSSHKIEQQESSSSAIHIWISDGLPLSHGARSSSLLRERGYHELTHEVNYLSHQIGKYQIQHGEMQHAMNQQYELQRNKYNNLWAMQRENVR